MTQPGVRPEAVSPDADGERQAATNMLCKYVNMQMNSRTKGLLITEDIETKTEWLITKHVDV